MELGFFLLELLPAQRYEDLMEQVFALCYASQGGFSYAEVRGMTRRERDWFLNRIAKQKEREADAIRSGNS